MYLANGSGSVVKGLFFDVRVFRPNRQNPKSGKCTTLYSALVSLLSLKQEIKKSQAQTLTSAH